MSLFNFSYSKNLRYPKRYMHVWWIDPAGHFLIQTTDSFVVNQTYSLSVWSINKTNQIVNVMTATVLSLQLSWIKLNNVIISILWQRCTHQTQGLKFVSKTQSKRKSETHKVWRVDTYGYFLISVANSFMIPKAAILF